MPFAFDGSFINRLLKTFDDISKPVFRLDMEVQARVF